MGKTCPHCDELKFKNVPAGLFFVSGKLLLTDIETPTEPLNGLLIDTDPDSNQFLKSFDSNIQFMFLNNIIWSNRNSLK